MKILLTNDDGLGSQGLKALQEVLTKKHEVWIVAPFENMSGTSHSVTLKGPVMISKQEEREFGCKGTPADCVLFSLLGALPVKPDMVVSGLNHGPNLGTDVIYSGTAAAARQGALMGVPSVATSIASGFVAEDDVYFAAEFILKNLDIFYNLWSSDHFVNINFPQKEHCTQKVKVTHLSRRTYSDNLESFSLYEEEVYYFLRGAPIKTVMEEGSDWEAVSEGDISITPVYLHPVIHEENELYAKTSFRRI